LTEVDERSSDLTVKVNCAMNKSLGITPDKQPAGYLAFIVLVIAVLAMSVCGFAFLAMTADWRVVHAQKLSTQSERDAYARRLRAEDAVKYFREQMGK
jgi:hypothetical protein